MIANEQELRHAYESIAKMYTLRDRISGDKSGDAGTRQDEIHGVDGMIRKIERQVAEYLVAHPERNVDAA